MRDEELTGETIARRQKELKDREAKALNGGGEDTRPCEKAPYPDAPIAPIMQLLDERLSTNEHEPPMRNIMGQMAMVRVRKPRHPSLHELAPEGSETRLEDPILPLLTEHDETSLVILIERHINFEKTVNTKKHGDTKIPVSLAPPFVRHYHRYADSTLPVAHAIATMPLVLPNGKLIAPSGLDHNLGIIFRIDPKLAKILPRPGSVKREDVVAAMKFLLGEWLVDVTATTASKCVWSPWRSPSLSAGALERPPGVLYHRSKARRRQDNGGAYGIRRGARRSCGRGGMVAGRGRAAQGHAGLFGRGRPILGLR